MQPHAAAAANLAALFEDGGARLLATGGLGHDWATALHHVPAEVITVGEGPGSGLLQLLRLRDFWVRCGDLRPALAATRALLEIRRRDGGADHPDVWVETASLGALIEGIGEADQGAGMIEGALAALTRRLPADDPRMLAVLTQAGRSRVRRGALAEAEPLLDAVWRHHPAGSPRRARAAARLGEVRVRLGRHADALDCLQEAWQHAVAHEGPDGPSARSRARLLGRAYVEVGRYPQAVGILRPLHRALASGADQAAVGLDLGVALVNLDAEEEGLRLVEASVRWTRAHDAASPVFPGRLATAAQLRMRRGHLAEAEGLLLEALEASERLHGATSHQVALRQASLGRLCARLGRIDEALGWLEPAASLLRSALGDDDDRTAAVVEAYGTLMAQRASTAFDQGDRELGRDLMARGLQAVGAVLGSDHPVARRIRGVSDGRRV